MLSAGGDLDPSATAQELQQLFGSVAPCSVDLRQGARSAVSQTSVKRPDPRRTDFAYIAFDAAEHVEAAVQQLNGRELHGSILRVLPRRPPAVPRPRTRGKKQGPWLAAGGTRGGGGGAPTRVLLQVRLQLRRHIPCRQVWGLWLPCGLQLSCGAAPAGEPGRQTLERSSSHLPRVPCWSCGHASCCSIQSRNPCFVCWRGGG